MVACSEHTAAVTISSLVHVDVHCTIVTHNIMLDLSVCP